MKCFCLSLFLLVAGSTWAHGQLRDKIYLTNETSVGNVEIVEVNKKKVKVRNQQGKEIKFKSKDILMLVNGKGNFLAFPVNPHQIKEFQSSGEKEIKNNLIITRSAKLIPARIRKETREEIRYDDLAKEEMDQTLPASELAVVLYKNGNHKLLVGPSEVAGILNQLEEKAFDARYTSYKDVENSELNPFSATPTGTNEVMPYQEAGMKSATDVGNKLQATHSIDPEVYSRKALQKTTDLGTYLAIISDRNNSMNEANKAVELAVNLFINEDAEVEVSSREGRNRYKVRAYLNRLKLLKYDKVEISWTDISYVSELKKGVDGNYYGIITLQQRFKGYMDNRVVYGDLTEKNIEVMVVPYQKEMEGKEQQNWDVFLSDVGVVVTKFDQ